MVIILDFLGYYIKSKYRVVTIKGHRKLSSEQYWPYAPDARESCKGRTGNAGGHKGISHETGDIGGSTSRH